MAKARLFESIGVTPEEESVYQTLLDHRIMGLEEIEARLAVKPGVARTVVDSLEKKGLVSRLLGDPPRFVATPPAVGLEVLALRKQQELEQVRHAISDLATRSERSPRMRPDELVQIVTGREATTQRFYQLQLTAQQEVLVFDRPPYAASGKTNTVELDQLRRGVTYRAVYDPRSLEEEGAIERLRGFHEAGEQARTYADLPSKLVIVDRRLALLPLQVSDPEQGSLTVHQSSLLDTLVAHFEVIWRRATPLKIGEEEVGRRAEPKAARRTLVNLMAAGLQDRAIARQLGISPRTFDRRLQESMKELEAKTRFQAGVNAVVSGWIQPGDASD